MKTYPEFLLEVIEERLKEVNKDLEFKKATGSKMDQLFCENSIEQLEYLKDVALNRFEKQPINNNQTIPTRMFCQICGKIHKIDFWVPNEIWQEAIHPRWQDTHVCLNCFMERADERLLAWDKEIKLMPCSMATQIEIQNSVKSLTL